MQPAWGVAFGFEMQGLHGPSGSSQQLYWIRIGGGFMPGPFLGIQHVWSNFGTDVGSPKLGYAAGSVI
jgi:hypothetical protein